MEKLIELLSEYDEYRWEKRRDYWWTKDKVELDVKMIIFKQFWFIKWLVENDKINLDKIEFVGERTTKYQSLLMLLSISDTPIEDLISYLK